MRWIVAVVLACMVPCLAEPGAPIRAPLKDLSKGKAVTFTITYPPRPASELGYHAPSVVPPPRPAPPPPPLPFKVPPKMLAFVKRVSDRYDRVQKKLDRLRNPVVKLAPHTKGTLNGDFSSRRQYVTLKVPFSTGFPHPFSNF